jgi:hypothetical protein
MRVSRVGGDGCHHAAGVAAERDPLDHDAMDVPFNADDGRTDIVAGTFQYSINSS